MNKVMLIGRLARDSELRYVGEENKPVLNLILAVQRPYLNSNGEREVDFIPVSYWRRSAQTLHPYLTKGKLISILGRINIRVLEREDGTKRYITQITSEEIQFLDYGKKKEESKEENTKIS
ncbi:single-stranded DNA-binding protein [Clostridium cochlearium]|nr:single-stranded DNA-binding protein [Clostridium cochlearium]MCG4572736.1 single-stranded DNA-binding protein [Clostridium cochlearium]MCG4580766.1 single-stranded DNA-binding protein [Clostridium cochlearium]MCR1970329.1 single-stranded DNA-binding protein [Clostridium cochlearium]MDU1444144.1 single-stranded DNA-binding protein [Clostridium cochlearium]